MSSLMQALEKLDLAVAKLEDSAVHAEKRLQQVGEDDNVVDVDFVAKRLDNAISTVEGLLSEDEQEKQEQDYATSDAEY